MKKSTSFVFQAGILAAAGLITKVIGFVYRIPMANILGNTGNGIYSVAFGIYGIVLILSSYSMPVSVSKLISERTEIYGKEEGKKVFLVSLFVAIILGWAACFSLFIGSDFLAAQYHKPGIQMSLKILAPTTFVVAIAGCFRGYYQGYGNMVPTSVSQIIEQLINAFVSLYAASTLYQVLKVSNNISAVKSAGATLGTFLGALGALSILVIYYVKYRDKTKKSIMRQEGLKIGKKLFLIMLPIIFSQTIYQIGYTLDDLIFSKIMLKSGMELTQITNLQGVFNTQYTQLINLPVGMATAFGVSALPRISIAFAKNRKEEVLANIQKLVSITSLIVFPAFVGLTICSDEIMKVLFPTLGSYHVLAKQMLFYGSSATVFYSFSTVTTSILQGCNEFKIPVRNSFISLIIHLGLVVGILRYTSFNIYGLLIGDIVFPAIILILNLKHLKKQGLFLQFKKNILPHLMGSISMGVILLLAKKILTPLVEWNSTLLVVEVIIGGAAYGIYELIFKLLLRYEQKSYK